MCTVQDCKSMSSGYENDCAKTGNKFSAFYSTVQMVSCLFLCIKLHLFPDSVETKVTFSGLDMHCSTSFVGWSFICFRPHWKSFRCFQTWLRKGLDTLDTLEIISESWAPTSENFYGCTASPFLFLCFSYFCLLYVYLSSSYSHGS